MNNQKIYAPFQEKIKNQSKEIKSKVIFSFENISQRDAFISKNKKLETLFKFNIIPSVCMSLSNDEIRKFEKSKSIKRIEEDQKLRLSIFNVSKILGLDEFKASEFSYTGKNIKIGIIDTGITGYFPSVTNIVSRHYNLNKEIRPKKEISHGTIMASLIGNQFKDSEGHFIGIAPDAKILDFNISNSEQQYYFSDVLRVFDLIIEKNIKVDVLLVSLTTITPSDGKDILSLACNLLIEKGIIIVCPAGNNGPQYYTIGSPGAAENVITIGALTEKEKISHFSGKGPSLDGRIKPDFCLPGSEIKIPLSKELTIKVTGTSVAAALCVGIISLIKEYNLNISLYEIKELLVRTSINLNQNIYSQGFGLLNAVNIFKSLNVFNERIIPYGYLIKKSLGITIEFIIIAIIIFFIFYFFMFI
ncbi:MAG: S8 family serine peptidase [Promethearchaeota archaeon]